MVDATQRRVRHAGRGDVALQSMAFPVDVRGGARDGDGDGDGDGDAHVCDASCNARVAVAAAVAAVFGK